MSKTVPDFYWNQFSICSLFVRYTLELQNTSYPDKAIKVNIHPINIYTNEQLSEEYLAICPRGQVPAFVGATPEVMMDSEDIALWIAEQCPEMLPAQHAEEIKALHHEVHAINFGAITFHDYPERGDLIKDGVAENMAKPGISDSYKKALKYKVEYMQGLMKKTGGFSDAALAKAEADTRHFLAGISKILKANHGGPWLYGAKPTILDSTLGVFVARLHDVPRTYLLPDEIDQFMQPHLKAAEWQKVTDGKPTWYYRYTGKAKGIQPK